jgi:hypothetical protein
MYTASQYALDTIRARNLPIIDRCTLLAVAALADEALFSSDGYRGCAADQVAELVAWAPGDVAQSLTSLVLNDVLVSGDEEGQVRLPERAFNPPQS